MQIRKVVQGLAMAGLALAATSSSASADWYHHRYYHHGPGPVLGLAEGLIVGAATIATLPFAILGAAVRPPPGYYEPPPPRSGYYQPSAPPSYGPRGYYGHKVITRLHRRPIITGDIESSTETRSLYFSPRG